MKRFSFLAALLLLPIFTQAAEKLKDVSMDKAAELVAAGKVTVLDVRTEDEFKEGHIKGAKNVDFTDKGFAKSLETVDKTKPVLVHCQAGGRSTRSLPQLKKAGFTEIYHLKEGMAGWIEAGKPVEK